MSDDLDPRTKATKAIAEKLVQTAAEAAGDDVSIALTALAAALLGTAYATGVPLPLLLRNLTLMEAERQAAMRAREDFDPEPSPLGGKPHRC